MKLNLPPPLFPLLSLPLSGSVLIGYSPGTELMRRLTYYRSGACVCLHVMFWFDREVTRRTDVGVGGSYEERTHTILHRCYIMRISLKQSGQMRVWMSEWMSMNVLCGVELSWCEKCVKEDRNGQTEPWEWGHGKNDSDGRWNTASEILQFYI